MMGKHMHDPYVASDGCVYCEECTEWLGDDEYATRRVKAASRLSAKDARHQATEHDCMDTKFRSDLLNYADILEGK